MVCFEKNTISFAGQSLKDGSKNMSYHVQQNTQQRSLGIFIVIAFHVLLIWGLANGLGGAIGTFVSDHITLSPTLEKTTPPEKITPEDVIINSQNTLTIDPIETRPLIFDETPPVVGGIEGGVRTDIPVTISTPRIIRATKPEYPSAASRLGEEGTTGLSLYITTDGRVTEAKVFSSSGSSRLDEAAIKHALRNWAFTPCMEGDKAIACWHQTKLVWRLE
jgi:periplasmic protein TonB